MVESHLDNLLKVFEPYFNCPLSADALQTCLIKLKSGIKIQIELNNYGLILIGCEFDSVLGRYQDLLLKEALKANYLHSLVSGCFGFSRKNSALILFKFVDPLDLKPNDISKILDPFIIKAKLWNEAIKNNLLPAVSDTKEEIKGPKLFGL